MTKSRENLKVQSYLQHVFLQTKTTLKHYLNCSRLN